MTRVLGDFVGVWTLNREIIQVGASPARFEGTAKWTPIESGMEYAEQGKLLIAGQPPMTAQRQYSWDEKLNIYFDDGRFFHQVPRDGGDAAHWCDPDQYDVSYDFKDWPNWTCAWTVKGPRKDYWLRSHYAKT